MQFFETVLNTCVRSLPYPVRCLISVGLFLLAIFSLKWSIGKKGLAYGFYILCILSVFLAIVYVAV